MMPRAAAVDSRTRLVGAGHFAVRQSEMDILSYRSFYDSRLISVRSVVQLYPGS